MKPIAKFARKYQRRFVRLLWEAPTLADAVKVIREQAATFEAVNSVGSARIAGIDGERAGNPAPLVNRHHVKRQPETSVCCV